MTEEKLLQAISEWVSDRSRSRQETIDGLNSVCDECAMQIEAIEADEGEEP